MAEASTLPFPDVERARFASRLGMLVFLASEVMLFGGIFGAAIAIRLAHSRDFAEASTHMHFWLGGINTAVLLTSSLLVAIAVATTRDGRPRATRAALAGAALLGLAFLAIKFVEYWEEYREGVIPGLSGAGLHGHVHELLMNLYFVGTGLHAVHLTVGIGMLLALAGPFSRFLKDGSATAIGNVALYWHLVDIVWVFLYPTLYLARP